MIIHSMMADRKLLVKELERRLGIHSEYKGAPVFVYKVGDYTVRRDGHIEVEDEKVDIDLLRSLHKDDFIDGSWDKDRECIVITLPYDGHTGATLTNLTYMVAGKSKLINKSICCKGAFSVSERFLAALGENEPKTAEEFLQLVYATDANHENSGLAFEEHGIVFAGFSADENINRIQAYMDLATLMNRMSKEQTRVRLTTTEPDNEKYAFRVWLMRLGMQGDGYKTTRKYLLEHLNGNAAFRTKEQEETFRLNQKAKRAGVEA